MAKIILALYAILMGVGGYMGYAKAGSQMSLIMGIFSAIIIIVGLIIAKKNQNIGYGLISGMTFLLVVTFAVRLVKSGDFMPSGMLIILSMVAMSISLKQLLDNPN